MKWKTVGSLLLACFVMACTAARRAAPENNLDGRWKLAVFPYQKKTLAEVFGTRVVEMQFDKTTNTVTGTTGCNRFSGNFTATADRLSFSQNRVLTKMACTDYDEQLFLNTLDRTNRFRLIEGQLELMQDTVIVMIFARMQ